MAPTASLQATPTSSNEILEMALAYAARGWAVLPLHAPSDGRCTCARPCQSPGKHPRTYNGSKGATTDPGQIRAWWDRWPDANVGVATGSGLVVVDVDPRHRGDESLQELIATYGEFPPTLHIQTGGGGDQFYFLTDQQIRSRSGALGLGIDVKGEGGYVVAPPSIHASGSSYRFAPGFDSTSHLAAAPGWLLDLLVSGTNTLQTPGEIPEGMRNTTLASIAGKLRREGAGRAEIEAVLLEENKVWCSPPLPEDEVRAIAASISRYRPMIERIRAVHQAIDADLARWRGRAGASDYSVLHAHLAIAKRAKNLTYDASVREVAERAGLSAGTVSRSHGRLQAAGWLQRVVKLGKRRGTHAQTWTLRVPAGVGTSLKHTSHPTQPCVLDASLDQWRSQALGKSALRVWAHLQLQLSLSATELAAALGVSPRTIRRHLVRLASYGLAERLPDGSWRWLPGAPQSTAEKLGTDGMGQEQRHRHRQEREGYRTYIREKFGVDPDTGEILQPDPSASGLHEPSTP